MSLTLPLSSAKDDASSTKAPSSPTSVAATTGSTPAASPGLPSAALSDGTATPPLGASAAATKGSAHVSASKKPPTLSDIAARMKLEGKEAINNSDKESSTNADSQKPLRGRLGLAGRLNSSSSASSESAVAAPAPPPSSHRSDSTQVPVDVQQAGGAASPQPLALGIPPSSAEEATDDKSLAAGPQQDALSSSSAEASNTQDKAAAASSSASSSKAKGLPSLEEIRARMAKKGHESPNKKKPPPPPSAWDEPVAAGAAPTNQPDATEGDAKKETASPALPTASMGPPASTQPLSSHSIRPTSVAPNTKSTTNAVASSSRNDVAGQHPLQHKWTLFFDSKTFNPANPSSSSAIAASGVDAYAPPWLSKSDANNPITPAPSASTPKSGGHASSDTWEAALKILGAYRTVESFMSVFTTIKRPSQLDRQSNYHLFKSGVKPMWEDPANANGGKWTLSFTRGYTNPALLDRSWMWLVLALIGEELDLDDEVTGAVVSTRPKVDRIALWLRSKNDVEKVNRLGKKLVDLLEVEREPGVSLEFSVNSGGAGGFTHSKSRDRPAGYWSFDNPAQTGLTGAGGAASGGSQGNMGGVGGATGSSSRPPARTTGGSFSGSSLGGGAVFGRSTQGAGMAGRPGGAASGQGNRSNR